MQCGIWNHSSEHFKISWINYFSVCTLNGFFVQLLVTLVIWKTSVHWVLQIFKLLIYINIQYLKSTFVNITTDLIREAFECWKAAQLMVVETNFTNCNIYLKTLILLLVKNAINCCPWCNKFTSFILEQISAKSSRATVCQLFCQVQAVLCENSGRFYLYLKQLYKCFSLYIVCWYAEEIFYAHIPQTGCWSTPRAPTTHWSTTDIWHFKGDTATPIGHQAKTNMWQERRVASNLTPRFEKSAQFNRHIPIGSISFLFMLMTCYCVCMCI